MFKRIYLVAFALIAIGFVGSVLTFSSYYKSISISENKTISAQQINEIEIDLRFGEIDIVPTTSKEILVDVYGKMASGVAASPIIEEKGNTLEIKSEEKFQLMQLGLFKPELKVTVYLPQKQYEEISVKTSVGDIDVQQMQAISIEAKTNFGDVDVQDVKSNSVLVKSDVGKLELTRVEGEINAETQFGDVDVFVQEFAHNIDVRTELGEIKMETKTEPKNVRVEASTDLGQTKVFNQKGGSFTAGDGSIVVKGHSNLGNIKIMKR
jgi:DUF4097 and DUF4098 domain-containing protein YvlB